MTKKVLESPNIDELMVEFFPQNDDKEYQDISENFKKIVKEQCNIGARKMFMITDAIQCQPCYHYETPGHACCTCGKASPGASDEVQERVFQKRFVSKNSRRAHENNHKARDHFKNAKKKSNPAPLMDIRMMNDIEYIFSRKVSPEKHSKNGTVLRTDQNSLAARHSLMDVIDESPPPVSADAEGGGNNPNSEDQGG